MTTNPFGRYTTGVASFAAAVVLAAWIATNLHLFGLITSPQLDSIALVVLGVIFGTGAGAQVVANGVGAKADAANVRLDAIHAPGAPAAASIIANGTPLPDVAPPTDSATPAP